MRTLKKDELKTKLKIHCIEAEKKGFDSLPLKKVQQMIGHLECDMMPYDKTELKEVWTVKMMDESWFECETQWQAQVLSNQEMIKAMLMELLKKCNNP